MTAMSGSFDRPDRPPTRARPHAYDPYEDASDALLSAPPNYATSSVDQTTATTTEWAVETTPRRARDARLFAEARPQPTIQPNKHASIVPAGSVTGRSLTLVISIMCFLACLTSGAVFLIHNSAEGWLRDIASEVTVQVEPREGIDTDKVVSDAVALLAKEPGVTNVKALSFDESSALLEPWLGQADVLKSLPVPRLIALEIDRNSPPDLDALRSRLASGLIGVSLDDHRHWQAQIRTVTRSFALGGFMILALVAAATVAIIESATRSSMASHRDIVEVLHFVGATNRFIAREFETHFLILGIKAGLVGAAFAGLVFLIAPPLVDMLGGQTVTAAELRQLVGSGTLDLTGYSIMGGVVVIVAGLCMLTSRLGVYRILNSRD